MNTVNIIDIIRKCKIFNELSEQEILTIAKLGHIEKFQAGETVYKQGSLGTHLYVLSEGQVHLERKTDLSETRKANVTVFILREQPDRRLMGCWGELVGKRHVHMCSAICDKPTSVVSIPWADLKEVTTDNPILRLKILEKLILLLRDRIDSSYGAFETI